MRAQEFITESAASKLAKQVGSLPDFKYKTIGALMKRISVDHDISQMDLHHEFVNKYGDTPDHWIKDRHGARAAKELKSKLASLSKKDTKSIDALVKKVATDHKITGSHLSSIYKQKYKKSPRHLAEGVESDSDYGDQPIVKEFIQWAAKKLNLQNIPEFEFSTDTQEAQDGHHTGRHVEGSNACWVYVANRNMVDVMRTIFHELVHVRQGELNMIKPGDSYPGSPIEVMADALAGKYIKIFGKQHHEIFQ